MSAPSKPSHQFRKEVQFFTDGTGLKTSVSKLLDEDTSSDVHLRLLGDYLTHGAATSILERPLLVRKALKKFHDDVRSLRRADSSMRSFCCVNFTLSPPSLDHLFDTDLSISAACS